jgi:1-deoxy-D-xylulose 5-phosphate reductoisomerase
LGIAEVIERVLDRTARVKFGKMEDVLAADEEARRVAKEEVERVGAVRVV